MKKIEISDYKYFEPNNSRLNFDSLDEKRQNDYLIMKSVYYHYLLEYLCKKTSILDADNQLKESNLNFIAIEENNMDIYQYLASEKLSYFYIRNNIYIENLTVDEQKILIRHINNIEYDNEVEKLIESTYQKAITEANSMNEKTQVPYGPISPKYMCENGTLVIGLRYDEFNENNLSGEEWSKNHDEQGNKLINITLNLEFDMQDKIKNPVRIIQYNESSIKKKNDDVLTR